MLTSTSTYAVRAASLMAQKEDELPLTAKQLSKSGNIPMNYLSKILRVLVRADILSANRGIGGGFRFARSPSSITIMDIVELFEDVDRQPICPFGQALCSDDDPCSMHKRWGAVRNQFLEELRTIDLRSAAPTSKRKQVKRKNTKKRKSAKRRSARR